MKKVIVRAGASKVASVPLLLPTKMPSGTGALAREGRTDNQ
jgi:hypothetical protein